MKTNFIKNTLIIGLLTINIIACKEDEVIIEPATPIIATNENNVPNGVTTVNYSVQIVPVGNTGKAAGLSGATVTIMFKGVVKTATVDPSGIAVFDGLAPGQVSGYVSAPGFTTINFTASLTANYINNDNHHTEYATSTVYLIKKNADLGGRIYGDFDMDGNTSVTQAGNFQTVTVWVSYSVSSYPMGTGNGMLTSVSLDTAAFTVTSDATGNFSFTGLPSTGTGLSAQYWMEDVKKIQSSGATRIFNFAPTSVTMRAAVKTEVGDKQAL